MVDTSSEGGMIAELGAVTDEDELIVLQVRAVDELVELCNNIILLLLSLTSKLVLGSTFRAIFALYWI